MDGIALLSSLTAAEILTCIKEGSFKTSVYSKNNIIHLVGEDCCKLEIILSGKVAVERIDENGNLMSVAEFYRDNILGGNLLFSKNHFYPMTITAKQPAVILEINKDRLFQLFCNHHDFLKSYLEIVSDHTAILGIRLKHYSDKTIRERVMSFLEFEREQQKSHHIRLNMSKKALAEKLGVQRTSLSRELAKMKEAGLILYDTKFIELLK
jgi:CRP-like cAMP-binding protein